MADDPHVRRAQEVSATKVEAALGEERHRGRPAGLGRGEAKRVPTLALELRHDAGSARETVEGSGVAGCRAKVSSCKRKRLAADARMSIESQNPSSILPLLSKLSEKTSPMDPADCCCEPAVPSATG